MWKVPTGISFIKFDFISPNDDCLSGEMSRITVVVVFLNETVVCGGDTNIRKNNNSTQVSAVLHLCVCVCVRTSPGSTVSIWNEVQQVSAFPWGGAASTTWVCMYWDWWRGGRPNAATRYRYTHTHTHTHTHTDWSMYCLIVTLVKHSLREHKIIW